MSNLVNLRSGELVVVDGLAQYVRRISTRRHGTPAEFAQRCHDNGMRWMAVAGPWQERRGTRIVTKMINDAKTCRRYLDALAKKGIAPFVWGYPWQGVEHAFGMAMRECAGEHMLALLDPELGANPERSRAPALFKRAEEHAHVLVAEMAERGFQVCGLSTFGSGYRISWFPLRAYVRALLEFFRWRTFVGGQTYTENERIDPSMADFLKVLERERCSLSDVQLVPNFGLYKWEREDYRKPMSASNRRAVRKTSAELLVHLTEFINEDEPVHALIGWAENFADRALWATMARFARMMRRGACALPPTSSVAA